MPLPQSWGGGQEGGYASPPSLTFPSRPLLGAYCGARSKLSSFSPLLSPRNPLLPPAPPAPHLPLPLTLSAPSKLFKPNFPFPLPYIDRFRITVGLTLIHAQYTSRGDKTQSLPVKWRQRHSLFHYDVILRISDVTFAPPPHPKRQSRSYPETVNFTTTTPPLFSLPTCNFPIPFTTSCNICPSTISTTKKPGVTQSQILTQKNEKFKNDPRWSSRISDLQNLK